jgi:high affinity Mn2+ porin
MLMNVGFLTGIIVAGTSVLAIAAGPTTSPDTSSLGQANSPTHPASDATEKGANAPEQLWNFHVQNTDIVQGYPAFSAKYSGPHSLPRGGEIRETVSLDVLAGLRLWSGAEAHMDAIMFQGFGVGNAFGIEGFPNNEAFRIGTSVPNASLARLFIRQTIGFGGEQEDVPDDQLTLAGKQDVSRLTLTLGRFAASDIFDRNAYANSARTQFMSWGLVNNMGWDFPADPIGFTTGFAAELNQPQWTLRYGIFEVPADQNGLTAEDRFITWPYDRAKEGPAQDGSFGMVAEFERRYSLGDHPGAIRVLAFLNRANMANYSAATAVLKAQGAGADISSGHAYRCKYGFGLNMEQEIAKNIGLFSRLGWNDGREQSWMFNDVCYTASLGVSIKGESWQRPDDTFGLAGQINGISRAEQKFFKAGGLGILAGDGNLNYGWEKILETYYDFQIWKGAHAAVDYQFVDDPAFNRDRGPVSVFGVRFHWEF